MSTRPSFIIRSSDVPEVEGSYPAPFDGEKLSLGRDLGRAAGSVKLGMWQERLPPGRRTSFTHAHFAEEELVYVLDGACTVRIIEPGQAPREIPVQRGDTIAFPPGTRIAHCFVNRGQADAVLLVVGERLGDRDKCFYAEDTAYNEHFRATRPHVFWE